MPAWIRQRRRRLVTFKYFAYFVLLAIEVAPSDAEYLGAGDCRVLASQGSFAGHTVVAAALSVS